MVRPGIRGTTRRPRRHEDRLTEYEWDTGNPQAARSKNVEIRAREGFATPWTVTIFKDEPGPDGVFQMGTCSSTAACVSTSTRTAPAALATQSESESIDNEALAGFTVSGEPPGLMLERGGVRVVITGSPLVEARSVAESFVAW